MRTAPSCAMRTWLDLWLDILIWFLIMVDEEISWKNSVSSSHLKLQMEWLWLILLIYGHRNLNHIYGDCIIYCIRIHYDRMRPLRVMIWTWISFIGTLLHHWKLVDRQSLGHVAGHHLKDGSFHRTYPEKLINIVIFWDSMIMNSPPERLHELGTIALKVAESGDSRLKGPNDVKRPIQ